MKNIKILVATHKKYKIPSDTSLYLPIHVGCEGKKKIGFQGDNSGENISNLNPYYCELTGLFWAWKNLDYDYLGLVHYRRYFTSRRQSYREDLNMDSIILSKSEVEKMMLDYDVVVPRKRKYYIETLYSHYAHTHDRSHLDVTRQIISELNPDYIDTFDKVMNRRSGYMFNMFIMSKDNVNAYCEWLFPIINELYKRLDITGYSAFDARLFGRVSERLFNVWLAKQNLRIKETPFIYMEKINLLEKGKSFLQAKFFGKKYGQSF
ncbi:TPA: DUF4422 domain-containing protein [Streptococcus pneumoniae]|uniref:Putative glycosyl transferase n=1 Tax=Streptococcus pneumoniae TaxID=1313 RepID=Q4JZX9_STREE|nr:DUF4422 domain-containing protein [Streptococcus pneumoniae]MBW5013287.1 DUF4422 domain-containing protein [Streptococcus pneumoniae]MBW7517948.1 DUF4422 domain-containing protein [Streptococcus pneumoniae]MDG7205632.1 DUF4422 domain-containing protein [Streptococcus pneumoniae]MDG8490841.1 DUF4422 domain-containing protein [Streptococcus pneumoniae]MDG8621945.1 DUF4422 domain-containing protein [Streptococcus pneumoniae]